MAVAASGFPRVGVGPLQVFWRKTGLFRRALVREPAPRPARRTPHRGGSVSLRLEVGMGA